MDADPHRAHLHKPCYAIKPREKIRATKAQRAKARRSKSKSKIIVSPLPVQTVTAENGHKETDSDAEHKIAPSENNDRSSWKAYRMSILLSILLFLAGVLAAIAIAIWQKAGNYWIAFAWGLGAYMLLGFVVFFAFYYYVIKPAKAARVVSEPDRAGRFSAAIGSLVIHNRRDLDVGAFWLVTNSGEGQIVSPIHVMFFLRFTNLEPMSAMIESYTVEMQAGALEWIKLPRVNVREGTLFGAATSGALNRALGVDITENGFDYLTHNRNFQPNETVHGWVFLEWPEAYAANINDINWRLRMKNVRGQESVENLERLSAPESLQMATYRMTGEIRDLSNLRRAYYSELKQNKRL